MSPPIRRATWIILFLTAFALYLVSTTYLSQGGSSDDAGKFFGEGEENEDEENEDEERYLTYIPHSGFHNQRIALENALFLA